MITKKQRANAERIVALSNALGHLPVQADRTTNDLLNLSIPTAQLIVAGIVTGVEDTNDGVNDNAVADVERYVTLAVERLTEEHGDGWWTEEHDKLFVPTKPARPKKPTLVAVAPDGTRVTRQTWNDYSWAVLVGPHDSSPKWGAWSFNGRRDLAEAQLRKARDAWHGQAEIALVAVEVAS